jgi:hypothetical protein
MKGKKKKSKKGEVSPCVLMISVHELPFLRGKGFECLPQIHVTGIWRRD